MSKRRQYWIFFVGTQNNFGIGNVQLAIMTSQTKAPPSFRHNTSITLDRSSILSLISAFVDPLTVIFSLCLLVIIKEPELTPPYLILSLLMFAISFPGDAQLNLPMLRKITHIYFDWSVKVMLLGFFGYASRYLEYFDSDILITWLWLAPTSQVAVHLLVRQIAPAILKLQGETKYAVVVGVNEQSMELASRLKEDPYSNIKILGFFDDRVASPLRQRKQSATDLPFAANVHPAAHHGFAGWTARHHSIDLFRTGHFRDRPHSGAIEHGVRPAGCSCM